jgi:hypothetical protein
MKAGTEDTSGKGQIISNINACQAVVDVVKTTLGKSEYIAQPVLDTPMLVCDYSVLNSIRAKVDALFVLALSKFY